MNILYQFEHVCVFLSILFECTRVSQKFCNILVVREEEAAFADVVKMTLDYEMLSLSDTLEMELVRFASNGFRINGFFVLFCFFVFLLFFFVFFFLVGCFVLRHINAFGTFNVKLNHFDKSFKQFSLAWVQFCLHIVKRQKTVLFQTIQFSVSTVFVYI